MGALDAQISEAVEALTAAARSVVKLTAGGVGELSPSVAGRVVTELAEVEKLLVPVRLHCGGRAAAEPAVWGHDGSTSPAEWIARQRGIETGAATDELRTAARLSQQPEVSDAAQRGELSWEQLAAITAAVEADPTVGPRLLSEAAAGESLARLKEHCRDFRLKACSRDDLEYRRWQRRRARLTTDDEGATSFRMGGPAADRARIETVLGPLVERFFVEDRRGGRRRSFSARLYDAALTVWGVPLVVPSPAPADNGLGSGTPETSSPVAGASSVSGASSVIGSDLAKHGTLMDGHRQPGEVLAAQPELEERVREEGVLSLRMPSESALSAPSVENGSQTERGASSGTWPGRAVGSVRVSHRALVSGRCQPGDVSDWSGIDPLPIDAVRALLPGAFMAAVVTRNDATVGSVARLGRAVSRKDGAWDWVLGGPRPTGPAVHRGTPLEWLVQVDESLVAGATAGDGSFLGAVRAKAQSVESLTGLHRCFRGAQLTVLNWTQPICAVTGCNQTVCTQNDHRVDFAVDPVSDVDNADRLCPHHHRLKSHHGYRLEPGRGRRRLLPPPPGWRRAVLRAPNASRQRRDGTRRGDPHGPAP